MLIIKDTSTVPPENWAYYVAQTNFTISTKNYSLLYSLITDHCRANSVAVPSPQEVVDYICRNAHVSCYDSDTHEPLINKMGLPFVKPTSSCCTEIPVAPAKEETI